MIFHLKKKIIPLKYTRRIKRCILLACVIYIILGLSLEKHYILFISPFINYLVFSLSIPIEGIIQKKYIKLTKEKLKSLSCNYIAITGSYGKTSTKFILHDLLSLSTYTKCSPKSYNTINGLSIFVNDDVDMYVDNLILEFGASHKNDIQKLCNLFEVDYSIITGIGLNHLETFSSLDLIVNEKMKLLENTKKICVVNNDCDEIRSFVDKRLFSCKLVKVGESLDSDYVISEIKETKDHLEFKVNGKLIRTPLQGIHQAYNLTFALALAIEGKLAKNLKNLPLNCFLPIKQAMNRLEVKKDSAGNIIIDDSYNSNYQGFANALDVLSMYSHKVLITPGIVESGKRVNELIASKISEVCDEVYIIKNRYGLVIYNELIRLGYKNVCVKKSLKEAMKNLNGKTILIENDLPDIYFI